jgi:hypothetical protein
MFASYIDGFMETQKGYAHTPARREAVEASFALRITYYSLIECGPLAVLQNMLFESFKDG